MVRERGSAGALVGAARRSSFVQLHESSAAIRLLGLLIAVFGGRLLLMVVLNVLRDSLRAVKAV